MKHIIEIFEFPKSDRVRKYTIEDPESINPVFDNSGVTPKIKITRDDLQKYIGEKKIYYMHTYTDHINIPKDDLYITIFVYNKDNGRFYQAIYNEYDYANCKPDSYEFVNITDRLDSMPTYWVDYYCFYNFERFHTYQTTMTSLFDERKEAVIDIFQHLIDKKRYEVGKYKAEYIRLTDEDLYNKEFEKIYNERVAKLKDEITKELTDKRISAKNFVDNASNTVNVLQDRLNAIIKDD